MSSLRTPSHDWFCAVSAEREELQVVIVMSFWVWFAWEIGGKVC